MTEMFTPFAIGQLTLSNRVVVPPMCQYSAAPDGDANDWHLMHYGTLALSGAGLVIFEATAVSPEGRISNNDLGIWSDGNEKALKNCLDRIRVYSQTPLGVQLAHAGRKGARNGSSDQTLLSGDGGWTPLAPSALAYGSKYPVPEALDADGIQQIKTNFVDAAKRAHSVGFDLIEVHAAHGYLLHEFLSPLANHRTDGYGGDVQNRMRLTLEIFDAVRNAFPADKPVGIRISGSDWAEGGWNLDESVALAQVLDKRGCSFIHVSGGGLTPDQKLAPAPGYQVAMAAAIKRVVSMPVIAVGLITSPEQAATIIESQSADLVAVGRASLYNPRWAWHAAEALNATIGSAPKQWRRAKPAIFV